MKEIEDNYNIFKDTLRHTGRDGVEDFISWLDTTDFKTAPASTVYHGACEGGLCKHSLNVYDNLCQLAENNKTLREYKPESLAIVALLHDLSKTNFYEKYIRNEKYYNPDGSKYDDLGNYDYVGVMYYRTKDPTQRYLAADHGTNSYLLSSRYIPLTEEEMVAIINHHAGMDNNSANKDMNAIYNRYPLAAALHIADMMACYFNE